jgi:Family of unknown function (DUF6011)
MVSDRRLAQSATLRSIVRSGEQTQESGGMSQSTIESPSPDSVPERTAQRRAHRTLDSSRTHDYRTADDMARQAAYRQQVKRVSEIRKASTPQKNYIVVLLEKMRDHNPVVWHEASAWYAGELAKEDTEGPFPFNLADKTIKRLLVYLNQPRVFVAPDTEAPPKGQRFDPYDDVPSGYYALPYPLGSEMELHFYRVSRYKGSKKIKVQEQAGPSLYPIRHWGRAKDILDAIREDPRKAAQTYAEELGQCYHCGRALTDEDSRRKGIGPICEQGGHGW